MKRIGRRWVGLVAAVAVVAGLGGFGWLAWDWWGPRAPADPEVVAERLAGAFSEHCLRTAPADLRERLGDRRRYPVEAGETIEGEILVRDTALSRELGRPVLVASAPSRCRMILPEGEGLLEPVADAAAEASGASLTRVVPLDDARTLRVYRNPAWEQRESYLEMQVGEMAEAGAQSLTLGLYPHDRRRRVDRVGDPEARWEKATIAADGGIELAVAVLLVEGHELVVALRGRQAELVFRPAFYPFWSGDGYFGPVGGLLIDGELPSAYRACVENNTLCSKDERRFRMPLDQATLEALLGGRTVRLDTRTTLGERIVFDLPLAGLREALTAAVERNRLQASTSLLRAARAGDVEAVGRAFGDAADPNARTEHGVTALMHAVRAPESRTAVIGRLLEGGARVTDADARGWTALHHAVDRLDDDPDGIGPLLAAGADPNAPALDGTTPLMVAAVRLTPRTVARLVEAGALVDTRREDGRAPLDFANAARDWDPGASPSRPPFDVPADPEARERVLSPWLTERSQRAEAVTRALSPSARPRTRPGR